MITRIVKMTFKPEKAKDFLEIFNSSKTHIRNFNGCTRLELLYDSNSPNVFFTYSYWESEHDLHTYRNSELFKKTWSKTKVLFENKAEAWSLVQEVVVE